MGFEPLPDSTERVATALIDAAFAVHKTLGPGLVEPVYEACLCYELSQRNIKFRKQLDLPVVYKNVRLDAKLRIDLLVEECLIVELKSVERIHPLFEAQLLTYMKLTNQRLGLLINFNVPLFKDGIKRMIL